MQNFQDSLETCKQSFIGTFSICFTVPLIMQGLKTCTKFQNHLSVGLPVHIQDPSRHVRA